MPLVYRNVSHALKYVCGAERGTQTGYFIFRTYS